MLTDFLLPLCIGTILGFLSGLGTGGGSLLMLYLTLIQSVPQAQARLINLLFFLPSALIASLFRWKQGHLQVKRILPAILAGSATAAILTLVSRQWDLEQLRKLFGLLLLATGIKEITYRKPKA